jgi:predicted lysophospholipase L1 biosynthesis ABC-type transport system permease subunit
MPRLAPWLVVLAGFVALFLGFATDPLWPAQDMPPALARRYAEEAVAAGRIYTAGVALLVLGVLWLGLRRLSRRRP